MTIVLLLISTISPVCGMFCAIANFSKNRLSVKNAIVFGYACGWGCYGYIGDVGQDIVRHMQDLDLYKDVLLFQCFDAGRLSVTYTWDVWLWCVARLNNPYLLQSTAAFLGYTILSYIVFDYSNKSKLQLKQFVPMLLFALTVISPLDMFIGIRYANAFLISLLAIYRYYFAEASKITTALLFVVSIFLHNAALVIVAMWIVFPIVRKYKVVAFSVTTFLLLSFTSYTNYMSMISGRNTVVTSLLMSVLDSANNYQATSASFHSLFVRYLQMAFSGVIILRALMIFKKKKGTVSCECQKMSLFSMYGYLVALCLTTILGTNGNRFFVVAIIAGLVPFMESWKIYGFLKAKSFILLDIIIVGFSLISVMLYVNDMNWGTGSVFSVLWSMCFGAFSKLLF